MIDDLIKRFVSDEITKMCLKDKMIGHLVKKQKRGTFQAVQECDKFESEIRASTHTYIEEWLKTELFSISNLRKMFAEEVKGQVYLELASKGFGDIIK